MYTVIVVTLDKKVKAAAWRPENAAPWSSYTHGEKQQNENVDPLTVLTTAPQRKRDIFERKYKRLDSKKYTRDWLAVTWHIAMRAFPLHFCGKPSNFFGCGPNTQSNPNVGDFYG